MESNESFTTDSLAVRLIINTIPLLLLTNYYNLLLLAYLQRQMRNRNTYIFQLGQRPWPNSSCDPSQMEEKPTLLKRLDIANKLGCLMFHYTKLQTGWRQPTPPHPYANYCL